MNLYLFCPFFKKFFWLWNIFCDGGLGGKGRKEGGGDLGCVILLTFVLDFEFLLNVLLSFEQVQKIQRHYMLEIKLKVKIKIVLIVDNVICVKWILPWFKNWVNRTVVNNYCFELENLNRVKIWVKSCYLMQINFCFSFIEDC